MNTLDKIVFTVLLTLACSVGLIIIVNFIGNFVYYLVKVVQARKRKEFDKRIRRKNSKRSEQ